MLRFTLQTTTTRARKTMHGSLPISSVQRIFWLINLLLSSGLTIAQSVQPSFFHYTTENGLPSSECYEVIQDRKGYIWISTDNGVSRFNGYEFNNYGTEEGLIDKTVLQLQEDHRGWIWMSTFSGNLYIHRGDTIAAYEYNTRLQDIRNKYYLVDNFRVHENGDLELGLRGYARALITTTGEIILNLTSCVAEDYFSIYYDSETNFPLHMSYELADMTKEEGEDYLAWWYDNNIFQLTLFDKGKEPIIYQFPANQKDAAKQQGGSRAYTFPLAQGIIIQHLDSLYYLPKPGMEQYFTGHSPGYINCVYTDDQGIIYVGYNLLEGLKVFNSVTEFLNNNPSTILLKGHTVTHVFKDQWEGLWITTLENGVFYAPAPKNLTINISPQKEGDLMTSISASEDQGIFVAQASGSVFLIDTLLQVQKHSFLDNMNSVAGLLTIPKLPLLSASPLKYWSGNSWQLFTTYSTSNKLWVGLAIKKLIPALVPHSFWGLHASRGLYKFAFENEELLISQFYPLRGSNKLTALVEETPEKVWVGALDGLFQLADTQAPLIAMSGHSIYKERVEDICSIPGGGIVVATRGSGIYLLRGDSLTIWSEREGLDANTISHVYVKNDILWAVSSKGINRIPLKEGIEKNYIFSKKDGIPNEEISDIAFLGEDLFVLSQYHITKINPAQINQPAPPPVYIHDILLNGSPIHHRNLQSLSWEERNIQLAYHFLDYSQSGKIDYRFRLKPDDQWVYTKNNTLDLLNLNSDEYLLEIQARDKSGQWVTAQPLSILIAPPFWQTIWFIAIVIFIVFLISYAIFIRRMKELAKEKERIALQEQVSQLKQQAYRAQMNPHFIFNCMSTIQGMIIGDYHDQDQAVKMLANFSRLIRMSLEFSEAETLSLEEEVSLLENYLSLEKIRFNHNFSYSIEVAPDLDPDWIRLPPMLVQPFVENAVLHGMEQKKGDGIIIIRYEQKATELQVKIIDNGPGISVTKAQKQKNKSKYQHKSLGMTITQRRLEILNHKDYHFQIEEPKDDQGKTLGTTVTINIPVFS
ncbi:histidine kinase [Lewinella sp. LCG006]|uniref:sensor histidine kinase n=1 Tax=Lewinella sp. LCG006 TaxID=3231911 RepID=UPI003461610E